MPNTQMFSLYEGDRHRSNQIHTGWEIKLYWIHFSVMMNFNWVEKEVSDEN